MSTCLPHAGVLTAVLAAALLGACSNSQGPAPAQSAGLHTTLPSGPSLPDPSLAWSEQLCHALLPVAQGREPRPASTPLTPKVPDSASTSTYTIRSMS
jgi:hypothetical protein